jgi:hypothetical protein
MGLQTPSLSAILRFATETRLTLASNPNANGEFDMNLLNTFHFATALTLITGSTANAATILDAFIAEAHARWKTAECGDARHGRGSCAKHKFAKKSQGRFGVQEVGQQIDFEVGRTEGI